jgi:hypothetical protein
MEHHPSFFDPVMPFFEALAMSEFTVPTSAVTIAEVLPPPLRHGRTGLIDIYREYFANYMPVIAVTAKIAELTAKLRAEHGLRPPYTIQLATAINQSGGRRLFRQRHPLDPFQTD